LSILVVDIYKFYKDMINLPFSNGCFRPGVELWIRFVRFIQILRGEPRLKEAGLSFCFVPVGIGEDVDGVDFGQKNRRMNNPGRDDIAVAFF
jgi:hypothetical protein